MNCDHDRSFYQAKLATLVCAIHDQATTTNIPLTSMQFSTPAPQLSSHGHQIVVIGRSQAKESRTSCFDLFTMSHALVGPELRFIHSQTPSI